MTAWLIEFTGEIHAGTILKPGTNPIQFSGSGFTDQNPRYHNLDPNGEIYGKIAEHFGIKPPYSIWLRLWHPFDDETVMHVMKTWVLP
jgi:hypothetical protein